MLFSSLQSFECAEGDAMVYGTTPEPNRRAGGVVRCAIESEQCAGDTRSRGFEVGPDRGFIGRSRERMQERTG